ncbi:MAG: histone deacetylase family protein, partial [Alphaproteobacteria bacterium]|nr:histone deacetylase family protein [Alphaproteobacteria bacterium]
SLFWNFEDRLFISLHEETPGSGLANETGAWNNVLNLPLPKGTGSELFRKTFSGQALPKLEAFRPDILFVSAGFDMREGDPQASLRLTEADYRWLGETLRSAAGKLCEGRLVAALEGGYNPGALGACAAAFVSGTEGPTR